MPALAQSDAFFKECSREQPLALPFNGNYSDVNTAA